jgi:hypothetical protein
MTDGAPRSLEDFTRSLQRSGHAAAAPDLRPVDLRLARSFGGKDAKAKASSKGGSADGAEDKPAARPKGMIIGLEALAFLGVLGAAVLGPAYYTCHHMQDAGQFYYGMTIRSCVRDRVREGSSSAEDFVRSLTKMR